MKSAFKHVIEPRSLSFDGFPVGRLLPKIGVKSVGPWVFFDHMGPHSFSSDEGIDVLPHPHIGLATVTYLFEGSIMHRDTIGSIREITPGAVNLMVAGQGIAHSERSPKDSRIAGERLHGLQLWHALHTADEECEPAFYHYTADQLPSVSTGGGNIRVMMGRAYGMTSPVAALTDALYLEYKLEAGRNIVIPAMAEEMALYPVDADMKVNGDLLEKGRMAILEEGSSIVSSDSPARFVLIGGTPLGKRYMWWNFVSSSKSRIQQAMEDWKSGKFGDVTEDSGPRVPLPDSDNYSLMKD